MDWPVKVYSVDDAIEKAKKGKYPFRVTALMAPTLMGIPPAKNENELRVIVQKALSEAEISNSVEIEPV